MSLYYTGFSREKIINIALNLKAMKTIEGLKELK